MRTVGSAGSPIFHCARHGLGRFDELWRIELCTRKRVSSAHPWPQLTGKPGDGADGGLLNVGIGAHNERRFAAEFKMHSL